METETIDIVDSAAPKLPAVATEPLLACTQPEVGEMVRDLISKVADKWTMLALEALEEHGPLRFTQLSRAVGGVSQKMLTKTLRQMESDGLVKRTVFPVIPPHVEYELTALGLGLGEAFCPLWTWVQAHYREVASARASFRQLSLKRDGAPGR